MKLTYLKKSLIAFALVFSCLFSVLSVSAESVASVSEEVVLSTSDIQPFNLITAISFTMSKVDDNRIKVVTKNRFIESTDNVTYRIRLYDGYGLQHDIMYNTGLIGGLSNDTHIFYLDAWNKAEIVSVYATDNGMTFIPNIASLPYVIYSY